VSTLAVLSLRNRALIALITIVAAVFGGLALTNLKQELIPSIEFPQLAIVASYPGASPEVVEHDVSTPIETAIQGVPGLDTSTATSTTNSSVIQASFTYGPTSRRPSRRSTRRSVGSSPSCPTAWIRRSSRRRSTTSRDPGRGHRLLRRGGGAAAPHEHDHPEDRAAQGRQRGLARRRPGQAPHDHARHHRPAGGGLSSSAIKDALQQNGTLFPGGSITEDDNTLTVQTGEKLTSVEQVQAIPLIGATAPSTTVGSVAKVEIDGDPVTSLSASTARPRSRSR
jgi:HAE1 family hydrophobic/amphiphilic exporter-1